jgi:hypothetical protein
MAMLITLFLVLINIFNIVTTNSPNVEGMTAIAAWMLVCIFFVFGALGMRVTIWLEIIFFKYKNCGVTSFYAVPDKYFSEEIILMRLWLLTFILYYV